ncbi:fatty acyl-CoA reductase 1 [Trichonephila clavipes]|nr:fatty acyl-CoA reductase 1 [Trichonephila clavipes]
MLIALNLFVTNTLFFTFLSDQFAIKVLLETFLRCFPGIQCIYILLRSKKGVSPQERRKEIFSRILFNELNKSNPSVFEKVHVVAGDIALPNMGMSDEDLIKITENVTIVFHCAACISFFKPLRYIFQQNVVGVNNAIELCKNLKHCEIFVDTSTAYSNCNHDLILEERIYGIPYPAERFIEYYENGEEGALEQLHSEIKPDFPNHYVFCKCISENLVREKCSDIATVIARPALIAATWKGPMPRILFSDEAHFWLNGYVNKQNCRIWSEANPQVYVETPLHPEKLTVWCALWAGGILLQER